MHPLDVITSFSALNIEMPISTSKIPAALDTLSQRKAFYLEKRAQACPPLDGCCFLIFPRCWVYFTPWPDVLDILSQQKACYLQMQAQAKPPQTV